MRLHEILESIEKLKADHAEIEADELTEEEVEEANAKKKLDASKPRNFVAKNMKTSGAGKMTDKSKVIPRKEKHKNKSPND